MADYFVFTPAEERRLQEIQQNQEALLSPYAARSKDAVRARDYTPNFAIIRPPFAYDVDKIIHSPLYNRYSDKTQVFSFYRNDDLSRRALHVQFVSKIAKTIGRALQVLKATPAWRDGVGIPYAATFLNGRRWEDAKAKRPAQSAKEQTVRRIEQPPDSQDGGWTWAE